MAECRKGLSLLDEEKISEAVRNFPVLYDKSHKGYKERDTVKNAWTEVANSLQVIEDWHDAKNSYEIFKKRYLKKRNLLRKTDKFGHLQHLWKRHREILIHINCFHGLIYT